MKLPNLLARDYKIVEKRKMWFIIPSAIMALAFAFGIIWGLLHGSPLNLSMDFAGGYSMTLGLGTKLTDETAETYRQQIGEIAGELAPSEGGDPYGLTIASFINQGEGADASILIRYKAIRGADMDEVNERFKEELDKLFVIMPISVLPKSSGEFTATYTDPVTQAQINIMREQAVALGVTAGISEGTAGNILIVETNAPADTVMQFLTVSDAYSGQVGIGNTTDAVMSAEYLVNAFLAVALALTLMLVYIAFRFEVSMGVSAIIALAHDLLIMVGFMVMCNIEIGVTFIAAFITLLGYSINNTIILFDRVRDKIKPYAGAKYDPAKIANESVRDTLVRSLNTTITTLIPLLMIVFLSGTSIRVFALPIAVGLIAGTYSSLTILPSVWYMWKTRWFKRDKREAVEPNVKSALVKNN